jgi:hypothetical protein
MFMYMILLLAVGVLGDAVSNAIQALLGLLG